MNAAVSNPSALLAPDLFDLGGSTDSRWFFTVLVASVAVMRLVEVSIAARNTRELRRQGAVESGAGHYPWMVTLHTGFLVACVAEVWLLGRDFVPLLAATCLFVLAAAAVLRWWVVRTLNVRWTTRVLTLPGVAPIAGGPFRWLRHPNYVAVVAEIAALPLVHGAWCTALIFSVANLWLLRVRIGCEEEALAAARTGPGGWLEVFADRPRWIPR